MCGALNARLNKKRTCQHLARLSEAAVKPSRPALQENRRRPADAVVER